VARRINLVPSSERARTTTNFGMLGVAAGVLIVLCGLGLGYYQLNSTLSDRKEELVQAQKDRQSVEAQVVALRQYEQLEQKRVDTEDLVQQVYADRTLVYDFLTYMGMVVPESVWLQNMQVSTADPGPIVNATGTVTTPPEEGTVSLEGTTWSFENVAQLMVRMQLIPGLSQVDLGSAANEDELGAKKTFSIEAVLKNTQDADTPLPMSHVEVEGL
jgi:Tfp pilus assembly protein PilN